MHRRIFRSGIHFWIVAASAAAVGGGTAAVFLGTQDISHPWGRFASMYEEPPVIGIPHAPGDLVLAASSPSGPDPAASGLTGVHTPPDSVPFRVQSAADPSALSPAPVGDDALWRARRLSWHREFRRSLALYDSLLASGRDRLTLMREKARVLGWSGRYGEALDLYGEIVRTFPESRAAAAEARSKAALYDGRYRHGVEAYRSWLDAEPAHPEALFDLAQLYYGRQRRADATAVTDRLLTAVPGHEAAMQVRRKLALHTGATLLRAESLFFHSEGGSRQAELEYLSMATSLTHPFDPALSATVRIESRFYRFDGIPSDPDTYRATAGFAYRDLPDLALDGYLGAVMKSGGLEGSVTGGLGIFSSPVDDLELALRYRHDDVVENAATLFSGLNEDALAVGVLYRPSRKWQAGVDGTRSWYSDGNLRTDYGLELRRHLSYEPDRFSLFWRWDTFGFEHEMPDYFTPGSFKVNHVGFEATHHFDGGALYGGANNTSLRLRASLNFEPDGGRSRSILCEARHDWSDRLSGALLYDRTWNMERDVYSSDRLSASLLWYF